MYVCMYVCTIMYVYIYIYICMCVYVYVCVCGGGGGQCLFNTMLVSTSCGDPWAMAISRLTLTTIARLDSVCHVQDAA